MKKIIHKIRPDLIKNYFFRMLMFVIQFSLYPPKKFQRNQVKKILVVRLKHLGDMMLTLPIVRSLRENFPAGEITIVAGSWNRDLLEEFAADANKFEFYNVKKYTRKSSQRMSLKKRFLKIKQIGAEKYDLVIDLDGSVGFFWLYLFKKIKYLSSLESLRFVQNLRQLGIKSGIETNYDIHSQYELLNLAAALKILEIPFNSKNFYLNSRMESQKSIEAFREKHQLATGQIVIGIQPATFVASKLWEQRKFAELADRFIQKFNARIVFTGSPEEKSYISEIQKIMEFESLSATDISLSEYIAFVHTCDLIVCLDSLPQHIAWLVQTPAVVIYRTNTFRRWTPERREQISVIYQENVVEVADVLAELPRDFLNRIIDKKKNKAL